MEQTTWRGSARLAERMIGMKAAREVIPPDPEHCVRWHMHDYPCLTARWNYHPEYEIHLIRKGTGRFIVGDHIGSFEAGHVALIGSGLPHDWVSDLVEGEVITDRSAVVQFDGQWLRDSTTLIPELGETQRLLDESHRGIEFIDGSARQAARHIEAIGVSSGLERLSHVIQLLLVLTRAPLGERRYLAEAWVNPTGDDEAAALAEIALEFLFANHASAITSADAAELTGLAAPTFSKQFKRATGQNFSDTLRKVRVAHARQMLEHGHDSIADVCYAVGFGNLSNFNRQFKREQGETPRDFRRRAKVGHVRA
ncbi:MULTISPECIES: AraC family transcriptional regulator [unclassified Microbacterium]|uniref:AraC family transcriptional regulator n=1 Tax=unclassified Microbacterium TaxID=2609290 RepID=UPI00364ABB7D